MDRGVVVVDAGSVQAAQAWAREHHVPRASVICAGDVSHLEGIPSTVVVLRVGRWFDRRPNQLAALDDWMARHRARGGLVITL